MSTIKGNKRIFTSHEAANLTGICLEHLQSLAKQRSLGFLVRDARIAGSQAEQRFFTVVDLTALAMLLSPCGHESLAA